MEKIIYLDNAATTQVFDSVYDLMKENNKIGFYNPSASYRQGIASKKKLDEARLKLSSILHGAGGKFYFTSSATESNNTVFEGVHLRKGQVVLISKGEHPAVYNAAHRLENNGVIVREIPLTSDGVVDFEKFKTMVDQDVALISVMHVSNETGAVNDIKKLCLYAKSVNKNILFHSDGVQAFCKIKVNLQDLGVDLYSVSAHKIYAPRGIAGLWVKKGVIIDAFLVGGGQEDNFRSSTENLDGALAFSHVATIVDNDIKDNYEKVLSLKNTLLDLLKNSPIAKYMIVNSTSDALPHILSLTFQGIKGEVLMHSLESDGILISTGSACSSKKAGNRTLEAMGRTPKDVVGSVRISFSPYIEYDIDYVAEKIIDNVLRFEKNNLIVK